MTDSAETSGYRPTALKRDSLITKAAEEICRFIDAQGLKPGAALPPETHLSEMLGISRNFMIHERSALAALDRLQQQQSVQDIIFLDPPYDATKEYEQVLGLLGSTASTRLLAEDALVIAEHAKRTPLAERYGTLQRIRELKQGDAALSFYQRIVELPV